MADADEPTWPYGFRFEWSLDQYYKQAATDQKSNSSPISIKLSLSAPKLSEIMQHIPPQVDERLQASALSLKLFEDQLKLLNVSSETKKSVMQKVLGDLAENERENVVRSCSYWRQNALDHGEGYVDASLAHYLYAILKDTLDREAAVPANYNVFREELNLERKRRAKLKGLAIAHSSSKQAASQESSQSVENYLSRAEAIRELLIYANEKICQTKAPKTATRDLQIDTLDRIFHTLESGSQLGKLARLADCKRVASLLTLERLCEQNDWSLVTYQCETVPSGPADGDAKLFRRLFTVIVNTERATDARAFVRPYIEPYPLFTANQPQFLAGGRQWQRSEPDEEELAKNCLPQIDQFARLEASLHAQNTSNCPSPSIADQAALRELKAFFDYPEEHSAWLLNPFSHFRHLATELAVVLNPNEVAQPHANPAVHEQVGSTELSTSYQIAAAAPESPAKLRIGAYDVEQVQSSPTAPSDLDHESASDDDDQATPSQILRQSALEARRLRSDLAVLTHALLTARDIDMFAEREVVAARLSSKGSITMPVVSKLLSNSVFVERYGERFSTFAPGHHPYGDEKATCVTELKADTATVVEALFSARGVRSAEGRLNTVEALTSDLIPREIAERAIKNKLVQSSRKRKRRKQHEIEVEIKREAVRMKLEPEDHFVVESTPAASEVIDTPQQVSVIKAEAAASSLERSTPADSAYAID